MEVLSFKTVFIGSHLTKLAGPIEHQVGNSVKFMNFPAFPSLTFWAFLLNQSLITLSSQWNVRQGSSGQPVAAEAFVGETRVFTRLESEWHR